MVFEASRLYQESQYRPRVFWKVVLELRASEPRERRRGSPASQQCLSRVLRRGHGES